MQVAQYSLKNTKMIISITINNGHYTNAFKIVILTQFNIKSTEILTPF